MNRTRSLSAAFVLAIMLLVMVFATATSAPAKSGETVATLGQNSALAPDIPGTFLTGPNEGQPLVIALNFIRANKDALQMSEAEVSNLTVKDQYQSLKSGITHIYFMQTHNGIEVFNSILNANIASDGSIISVGNRVVPNLTAAIQENGSQLTAEQALEKAAEYLRLDLASTPFVQEVVGGAAQAVVFDGSGISQNPIPAHLIYMPMTDGTVRLAWNFVIYEMSGENWWDIRVDAATGVVLNRTNLIDHDNWAVHQGQGTTPVTESTNNVQLGVTLVPSSYLAYGLPVESPNYAVPAPPADARSTEISPWLDAPTASPLGWHASSSNSWTNTQGNNVDAHKGSTRFDCGATLECDPPLDLTQQPTTADNVNSATVNLFYYNNIVHDVTYEYGFDEAAGNFQTSNFGLGGLGNDRVNANAQAPGNCNANFGTPPDGSAPTMNMFICNIASPSRDGDLDNGVIAHEYGHGISNRLTGGPANVNCLNNAEQMGEGWSDLMGLILSIEPGDSGTDARGIGTWLLGEGPNGPGVRTQQYSTDFAVNTHTYNDIAGMAIPHGVGEVWATLVWEMVWDMIDEYGYNPDFYGDWSTGGNNLALQLILDGMKVQPCSPGFVDGRDGILLADQNLTGGQNQCLIWEAFARRGLGFSADQGSSGSTGDGTEGYDIPQFCEFLGATPDSADICVGNTAEFEVTIGNAFVPNVTFSADGHPAGTSATFSPNPVTTVPSTTTLTIDNTGSAAAGAYTVTITGTDSTLTTSTYLVGLNVYDSIPGSATLTAPANGAVDVVRQPTFSWTAASQAGTYYLEVDNNPNFGSPEYTATVEGTSHTAAISLGSLTTYYWRVTAMNSCGDGAASGVFSFTTEAIPPILLVDDDDNGPDVRSYYTTALDALGYDYDIWDTNNSDNEPNFGYLSAYRAVIWFTGDEFGGFAGPSSTTEAALGSFLDAGNCMFISSQDYRWDRDVTPFMTNYLGVGTSSNDNGDYSSVEGTGSVFGGSGVFSLNYPFTDYSDITSPNASAELAFDGNNSNDAAVNKDSGVYKTIFFSFPWEAISTEGGRNDVMQTAVDWCMPALGDLDRNPDLIEDTVTIGQVVTHTLTVSNTGAGPLTFVATSPALWVGTNPSGGTLSSGESMTISVVFDSSAAGVGTFTSTLDFNGTFGNVPIPVDLVLHVQPAPVYLPFMTGDGGAAPAAPTASVPWLLPLVGLTAVAGLGLNSKRKG